MFKKIWRSPWFKKAVVSLVVGVATGLIVYLLTKEKPVVSEQNIFKVESHDQQGGITAGQINFGKRDRILTDKIKESLRSVPVSKNYSILIHTTSQDAESIRYAEQIKKFLVMLGHKVERPEEMTIYSEDAVNQFTGDINGFTRDDGTLEEIIIRPQK